MQNLHLLEFLTEAFQCHMDHYPSTDNSVHNTEKLLLKTQVSEFFAK